MVAIEQIPGYASQVWGGFVWMVDGQEQRWSKRRTRDECEAVVTEAVDRLGVDGAFAE